MEPLTPYGHLADPERRVVEPWLFNAGGPRSRTRELRITSSLLRGKGKIRFRCRRVIGLRFPDDSDPVALLYERLQAAGLAHPEALKARVLPPLGPCLCQPAGPGARRLDVMASSDDEVLEEALLLGLSTVTHFDPSRPVIWTHASLTRCLELIDPRGFYA
jgi:hypothetical protein